MIAMKLHMEESKSFAGDGKTPQKAIDKYYLNR